MITEFIEADSARISSLRCGGKLHRAIAPSTYRELSEFCQSRQTDDYRIIGGLTNTLVLSGGVEEIAVLSDNLRGISVEGSIIKAYAGEKLSTLAKVACRNGLTGLEKLVGIPGTVGGALKGNAGCFGAEISESVIGVDVVDLQTGDVEYLAKEEIAFGYRYCNLRKDRDFVYRVWFDLYEGQYERIAAATKEVAEKRARSQPKSPSLGSVFKKCGAESAGYYIEKCGLKGYRYGGMAISDVHANFIVNLGGTPEEYIYLAKLAEKTVYERFGIKLVREVNVIGKEGN